MRHEKLVILLFRAAVYETMVTAVWDGFDRFFTDGRVEWMAP